MEKVESERERKSRISREQEEKYPQMSLIEKWRFCRNRTSSAPHACNFEFVGIFIRIFVLIIILYLFYPLFTKKQ